VSSALDERFEVVDPVGGLAPLHRVEGSILSIGCVGSALSIGSIGSFVWAFSIASFCSIGSIMSSFSLWLVMSFHSRRGVMPGPG